MTEKQRRKIQLSSVKITNSIHRLIDCRSSVVKEDQQSESTRQSLDKFHVCFQKVKVQRKLAPLCVSELLGHY